jgi:hypothetical protein
MKKTFELTHPKINVARMVDSVKHDIKKYLKRERNKSLPEGAAYWDFDCKFGITEVAAEKVYLKEINTQIDAAVANEITSFYIEILAKPAESKTV